jgi:hypothetical protein
MTTDTMAVRSARRRAQLDLAADAKAAVIMILVLGVLGAALGLVWQWWSPPGPVAAVESGGIQAGESEAWAAADGRFAVIAAGVGLLAGIIAWSVRTNRGPLLLLGLTAGGLVGSALTDVVGHLVRGDGNTYTCGSDTGKCIDHLPLSVHLHALLLVESMIAVLAYGLLVAFAARDDLGRPDPLHEQYLIRTRHQADDGQRDGDGPGALQQGNLPPQ